MTDLKECLASLSKDELLFLILELTDSDEELYEKFISLFESRFPQFKSSDSDNNNSKQEEINLSQKSVSTNRAANYCTRLQDLQTTVTRQSSAQEKINLYKSLFRGRGDVYALRWENAKSGKSGYSPVCKNKWVQGKCNIKSRPCADCPFNEPVSMDDSALLKHFRGDDNLCRDVIGLYPLLPDNSCHFLVLDFDEKDWKEDASAIREVCRNNKIPASFEVSRSGNGIHIWFFFEEKVSAKTARQFGEIILHLAMNLRHQLPFSSFDRMFPNQDEMPKGGYGNLIALPLQGRAVKQGHSVFVDENFIPYADQWAYLSSVKRIATSELNQLVKKLGKFTEVKNSSSDKTNAVTSEKFSTVDATKTNFNLNFKIELSDGVHIQKFGIPEHILSKLKRTAVFQNPAYYQALKMRLPTWDKPRYIDCSDETEDELILPRGCFEDISEMISELDGSFEIKDSRQNGTKIDVSFDGNLNDEQKEAQDSLLKSECGVLSAGTGFGKTVIATSVIAEKKVNTLIIVNTHALLNQWKKALKTFLNFDTGTIGGGKEKLTGQIDIAVMQSLLKKKSDEKANNDVAEVKGLVANYGMVIVDECHHISAFTFEQVLKSVKAKYIYGLTATPVRRDGHQPIIFMQCGKIRFKTDSKTLAAAHGFSHYLIPRFSSFMPIFPDDEKEKAIHDYYKAIVENEARNALICKDIKSAVAEGRNPLVLSERVEHIKHLKELLEGMAQNIILISGQGTLQQYAGRLHRQYEGKTEVRIYDYIDFKIPMLERMWQRRLKGYASIGYAIKPTANEISENQNALYNGEDFIPILTKDFACACKSIFISSPYLTKFAVIKFLPLASKAIASGVKIYIATKQRDEPDRAKTIPLIEHMKNIGCNIKELPNLSQRCAAIDEKLVWYGSADVLGWVKEDDCMLRFEDAKIAAEAMQVFA